MDEDTIKRDIVINIAKQIYIQKIGITPFQFATIAELAITAAEAWYEAQLAYCKKAQDDSFT